MKKVLIVMNSSNVTYGGGIVQVILNYAKKLKNDVYMDIAINEKDNSNLSVMFEDVCNHYFCLPNKKKNIFKYISVLYKICSSTSYDVIHVHGNSANMLLELFIGKICKIKKRIAHCHNSKCSHPIFNKLISPIFRLSYNCALACSDVAGEWLFGKNEFEILQNAIDLKKFLFSEEKRKEIRNLLNVSNDIIIIGHVGNINEQKNHDFIIDVFLEYLKKDEKVCLLLIGDGPLKSKIRDKIRSNLIEDKVFFVGIQENVGKWFSAMDLFIFPSKWEGLGMVAIEAQVSGLDVFASTEIPEIADISKKFHFLSLELTALEWCDYIMKNNTVQQRTIIMKDFDKYNIDIEGKKLLDLYVGKV